MPDEKIIVTEQLATFYEGLKGKFQAKEDGKGLSSNDYTTAEKTKLSGIENGANKYVLPVASSNDLGGVKVGSNLVVDAAGVLSGNYQNASKSASGLMSKTDKSKLDGFESASNYATKTYVNQQIEQAGHLTRTKVATLPPIAEADLNTIYMVPKSSATAGNGYNEYMLIDNTWEKIGDTETTLDYATDEDIAEILNS